MLEAATGAQAIELATGGQPDLVLVDWVLPDISGTEVILELRRQGLLSPMVMLTGRTTKMDEVVGLEVGADDYITKPFDSRDPRGADQRPPETRGPVRGRRRPRGRASASARCRSTTPRAG